MKPEDYLKGDEIEVENQDYNVLADGTVVARFYISSDDYEGELELTKAQLIEAIKYMEDNDGCPEALGNLHDGFWMLGKAEEEPDPRNPDLNRILDGTPPALWTEHYGDDPSP